MMEILSWIAEQLLKALILCVLLPLVLVIMTPVILIGAFFAPEEYREAVRNGYGNVAGYWMGLI